MYHRLHFHKRLNFLVHLNIQDNFRSPHISLLKLSLVSKAPETQKNQNLFYFLKFLFLELLFLLSDL